MIKLPKAQRDQAVRQREFRSSLGEGNRSENNQSGFQGSAPPLISDQWAADTAFVFGISDTEGSGPGISVRSDIIQPSETGAWDPYYYIPGYAEFQGPWNMSGPTMRTDLNELPDMMDWKYVEIQMPDDSEFQAVWDYIG